MYQALGGFILGMFVALGVFFLAPEAMEGLRDGIWTHRDHGGAVAIGLAQPFSLAQGGDDALSSDDVWAETSPTSCQAVLAIENRSDRPLSVSLSVAYRDSDRSGERSLAVDGGGEAIELAPRTSVERAVYEERFSEASAASDCAQLNEPGALVVRAEACPDEAGYSSDCREVDVDPTDTQDRDRDAPRAQRSARSGA